MGTVISDWIEEHSGAAALTRPSGGYNRWVVAKRVAMDRIYQCENCGLRSKVVAGAAGFAGAAIHCPRCGGRAVSSAYPAIEDAIEMVQVELADDGATREIPSLADEYHDIDPTMPTSLDSVGAEERARGYDVPTLETTPKGRPAAIFKEDTPSKRRTTEEDLPSVTRIETVEVNLPVESTKVADPVATKVSDRPKEVYEQDAPARSGEDAAKDVKGFEGKAWSISVIRRALEAEGIPPSSPQPVLDEHAVNTEQLEQTPELRQLQVDSPDGEPDSQTWKQGTAAELYESDEPAGPQIREQVALGYTPFDSQEAGKTPFDSQEVGQTPFDSQKVSHTPYDSPPAMLRPPRTSKGLLVIFVIVFMLGLGISLGVVWYKKDRTTPADNSHEMSLAELDANQLALAQQRAIDFGLEPFDPISLFGVTYQRVETEVPNRVEFRVSIANESHQPVSVLQVSAQWMISHQVRIIARAHVLGFEPPVSQSRPLEPGQSATTAFTLTTQEIPVGEFQESFVWVTIAAAGMDGDIFYTGSVLMIEIEDRLTPLVSQ